MSSKITKNIYLKKHSQFSIYSLVAYILTLLFSRLTVFLIEQDFDIPFLGYNIVRGYHIHHFTYGIIILVIVAFVSIFIKISKYAICLYLLFGISLGLIFDEFGIWIKLDPSYNQPISIIASTVVALALASVVLIGLKFPTHFDEYEIEPKSR
jgi:hypothetical protein